MDYIRGIPAAAFEGAEDRDIKVPAGPSVLEFKGLDFLKQWAIPNVYAILRHNGVELSKRDYLAGR